MVVVDQQEAYWNPLPDIVSSAGVKVSDGPPTWVMAEPSEYLLGQWSERNWRNVPGPIYGAMTDTCWASRMFAPHHISYENQDGQEFLYRQPRSRSEVLGVLCGAWNDPYRGWAGDGDQHWTPALVREWWRDRGRVREWIEKDLLLWSGSASEYEREAATGLVEYAAYLDGELETHLRGYLFWLIEQRIPPPGENLPKI
jgi:hypothetical protein